MFNFKLPTRKPNKLNKIIDDLLTELDESTVTSSEEYSDTADQLIKLVKLRDDKKSSWKPSPDALISVAGTLTVAFLVLRKEKDDVITSKAFGFLGKLK